MPRVNSNNPPNLHWSLRAVNATCDAYQGLPKVVRTALNIIGSLVVFAATIAMCGVGLAISVALIPLALIAVPLSVVKKVYNYVMGIQNTEGRPAYHPVRQQSESRRPRLDSDPKDAPISDLRSIIV